jgi:hypothetical protein
MLRSIITAVCRRGKHVRLSDTDVYCVWPGLSAQHRPLEPKWDQNAVTRRRMTRSFHSTPKHKQSIVPELSLVQIVGLGCRTERAETKTDGLYSIQEDESKDPPRGDGPKKKASLDITVLRF